MSRAAALQLVDELRTAGRISTVEAGALRGGFDQLAAEPLCNLSPGDFRRSLGLSMAAMAAKVGVTGKNPSRTWQRWEEGDRKPPYEIVAVVEGLSGGRVTSAVWAEVHREVSVRKEVAQTKHVLGNLRGRDGSSQLHTIADLFDRFEGSANVGRAIGKCTEHANAMRTRNSIPVRYWPALIAAARGIGLALDEATMVRLHLAGSQTSATDA